MNVYGCNGRKYFREVKYMAFSIHEATAEGNVKFHFSPTENIFNIARMKTFIVFLYNSKINRCYRFFIELNTKQIHTWVACTMFKINRNPTTMSQKNVWVKSKYNNCINVTQHCCKIMHLNLIPSASFWRCGLHELRFGYD